MRIKTRKICSKIPLSCLCLLPARLQTLLEDPLCHLPWQAMGGDLQKLQGPARRASQQAPNVESIPTVCQDDQPSDTACLGKLLSLEVTGHSISIQNCCERGTWLHVLPSRFFLQDLCVHASFRRSNKSWQSCSGFLLSSNYFHHRFPPCHCLGFSCSISHMEA